MTMEPCPVCGKPVALPLLAGHLRNHEARQAAELARITIVKTYDDNASGGEAITTTYSDRLSLADALGMLAFAQATTMDTYLADEGNRRESR